jgi:hypothetical protein
MSFFRLTACSIFAASCLLTGCSKPPEKPGATATAPKANEPKPTDDKSEFPKVTAEALAKEYDTDPKAATAKYKNKAVLISGTVTKKVGDASDRTYLVLKAGDAAIQCELAIIDDYTKFRIKTLKEGDAVSVLGEPDSNGFEAQPMGPKLLTMKFCKLVP